MNDRPETSYAPALTRPAKTVALELPAFSTIKLEPGDRGASQYSRWADRLRTEQCCCNFIIGGNGGIGRR